MNKDTTQFNFATVNISWIISELHRKSLSVITVCGKINENTL